MIIKLALNHGLNKQETTKYNAMKQGGVIVGSALMLKNLAHLENELKPEVGGIKRWLHEKNIRHAPLKDTVNKVHWTLGKGLQMGAVGALGGAVLGLGIHEGIKKFKKYKNVK